jgi:hypothetical protein
MAAGAVVGITAAVIVLALVVVLLVGGSERRERAADLAAEFWDWLRLGR